MIARLMRIITVETAKIVGSIMVLPCWNSAGNQFNGNVYVNSSASGVQFCGGSTEVSSIGLGPEGMRAKYFSTIGITFAGSRSPTRPMTMLLGM